MAGVEWWKGVPDPDWDAKLFPDSGHFLQSGHWSTFREGFGQPTFHARGDRWSCAAYIESGNRLYSPYGIGPLGGGTGHPPDQPDHPWAGFTAFKRSFGGRYYGYAGTWDLPKT